MTTTTLVAPIVIVAAVFTWTFVLYSRVGRHVAPLLESPHTSLDVFRGVILLDGTWNGLPIRIKSFYVRPPRLTLTVRVATGSPDLVAYVNRSGKIEIREVEHNILGERTLARVVEDELTGSGPPASVAIALYCTPARMESLRILLSVLGWKRFVRDREGVEVSRRGAPPVRWKCGEARDQVVKALFALQKMAD